MKKAIRLTSLQTTSVAASACSPQRRPARVTANAAAAGQLTLRGRILLKHLGVPPFALRILLPPQHLVAASMAARPLAHA